jgi:nitroreductase/dihydropteridine reductase
MEFRKIVMERYAVKKFDGRKIPEDKVEELMDIIRHAPSSFNLQPWKIKVVTGPEVKERLRKLAWDQEQITTCSHLLVFCADADLDGRIGRLAADMRKREVPEENVKAVEEMMRGMSARLGPEQRLAWAQRQLYLALGNALNGAKSLGFDSCPMEGFDPAGFAKELGLPPNIVPTALCPIGYAADKPRPKSRFEREAVFF